MQKYKRPKFTEEDLGENPLIESFAVKVREVTQGTVVQDGQRVLNNVLFEATPYTKIFTNTIDGVMPRKKVTNLNDKAQRLYLWLIYEIDSGKDYIWINQARYMEEQGIKSINTYKDAIRELVMNKFLAISVVKSVYWINPAYFFKGSRINKYEDKIIK